jgi:type I restriction enzyme S subunit
MKDLVTATRRGLSTPYLRNGTDVIRLVKAKDITTDGDLSIETVDSEHARRTPAFDRARLKPGDVLVTVAGSRFRAAVVNEAASDLIASNSLIALSFDRSRILPEFAAWYLNSSRGQADIQRWASGARMMSLNTASLLEVAIPVPPLEEQQRLVDLLRLVRSYREILDHETALLNRITDSLMEDVIRE